MTGNAESRAGKAAEQMNVGGVLARKDILSVQTIVIKIGIRNRGHGVPRLKAEARLKCVL